MISCGDIRRSDDSLLRVIEETGRVDTIDDDDNAFKKLGVNNPLHLAVKADEEGAAVMASSSAERRPICIIISRFSIRGE